MSSNSKNPPQYHRDNRHPHILELVAVAQPNINCTVCKGPSGGSRIYACPPCGFFLHPQCPKQPKRSATFSGGLIASVAAVTLQGGALAAALLRPSEAPAALGSSHAFAADPTQALGAPHAFAADPAQALGSPHLFPAPIDPYGAWNYPMPVPYVDPSAVQPESIDQLSNWSSMAFSFL